MNKMHAIAKIAIVAMGVYLLILSALTLLRSFSMVFTFGGSKQSGFYWILSWIILSTAVFIAVVYYFLIYRSSSIVQKIVGKDDLPDPINPSAWYPFALRLTVIVAGFFALAKAVSVFSMAINYIPISLESKGLTWRFYEYAIYALIYLAISIYLLCGAPHFVRWQMRKTREFCNSFPAKP